MIFGFYLLYEILLLYFFFSVAAHTQYKTSHPLHVELAFTMRTFCNNCRFQTQANQYIPCTLALREDSSQTNVILQYKLLAVISSAVCSVIQQS